MPPFRPTLGQAFVAAVLGLALLLGLLFASLLRVSERGLVRASDEGRAALSARIVTRVEAYLDQAEHAVTRVEQGLRFVARAPDVSAAESFLFSEMLDNPNLAELAFTRAVRTGVGDDGTAEIAPRGRFQVSVYRESAAAEGRILTRITEQGGRDFQSRVRRRPAGGGLADGGFDPTPGSGPDPTDHATFRTPSAEPFAGQTIWSDLSYSELDASLPEAQRRVVVTVLKAVEDRDGVFLGVLRAAILERALDALVAPEPGSPEITFLCDDRGRLLTRFSESDPLVEESGDLRVASTEAPAAVAAALSGPGPAQLGTFRVDLAGRPFLVGFQALPGTQGWRLGMVIAEDQLPGLAELRAEQRALLLGALGLMIAILTGGVMVVRWVGRDLGGILVQTGQMSEFEFAAATPRAAFREVASVLTGLEQAKTALRALSKYVPVALVRELFKANREPVLGGEARVLTIMFTDIRSFTTYAEQLSPDALAEALGRYLEAMTRAVDDHGGAIDKYIGDAVMALWNAPSLSPGHEVRACRAALDCVARTEQLYASTDWGDRPRFVTRIGLHTGEVMVGHFGAPSRLSYTALGDGVNLAARLEGLNKEYGTTILVSESLWMAAKNAYEFRRLDRVAVKGKSRGVLVFELVGDTGAEGRRAAMARAYEQALDHYHATRFADAMTILESQAEADPPSAVLLARCREFTVTPPPFGWGGVYVARSK
jgi:adenylate cyclase